MGGTVAGRIARRGHELDEQSGGREGGRGIRRLIDDLIEDRIQKAAVRAKREYAAARTIELCMEQPPVIPAAAGEASETQRSPPPVISVRFN